MEENQSALFQNLGKAEFTESTKQRLHFRHLPQYAQFLLDFKLSELAAEQLHLSRQLGIPVLKYFAHLNDEQLIAFGKEGLVKLLTALSQNKALPFIEASIEEWLNNQLPHISGDQIRPEDITLINLVRRTLFRKHIHLFSSDIGRCVSILDEMDYFTSESESISLKIMLSLQRSLYQQTQQLAKIGNWVWDLQTNTIAWSDELYRIYELEKRSLSEIDVASYNHPDDDPIVKQHMEHSRTTHKPHDFYYRIILPDGREKTLHAKGQVLINSSGIAEKMFGTLQDFTTQKSTQKKLEENQLFVKKITDLTPSLITVYNVQSGEYLYINKAIETLLGYHQETVLKNGVGFFTELIHPEDLEFVLAANAEALRQANSDGHLQHEIIKEFRYRIRHQAGEYRWLSTYGTVFERDAQNKVLKVINISVDITDQVTTKSLLEQRDKEIKNQDERYFRMINEVEDYAIIRLSKEGVIENWNTGAEKIKGYRSSEIIGNHFRIFYAAADQENKLPETLIAKAAAEGKATHEGWRIRKDKTRFWGSIVITAIHDDDGNIVGYSKVTRDLTQKKLAEDSLRSYTQNIEQQNRQLEEQNEQLESFNYIASHDLQEPLRKIRMFIERLKDNKSTVPETISQIEKACIRMQALIEDLLYYCQAEMIEEAKEYTSLNLLVTEILADYADLITSKEMVVEKSDLPVLYVHPLQIRQLLYNLISNAVKYRKADQPLKLSIEYNITEEYNDDTHQNVSYHEIKFTDNGIGFNQQYVHKIFGLFQRLHDKNSYAGTGLGLAICKKIVENHGGKITAHGEPGVGAKFCVYLPVAGDKA